MAIAIANSNLYHASAGWGSAGVQRAPLGPATFSATTGNTIVVAVAWRHADGSTDTAPYDGPNADNATVNTYTKAATYSNGDWSVSIWTSVNITGFTDGWVTGRFATPTNNYPRVFVVELSGVDSVDTGYAASGSSTSSPTSPGSDSTAVANEWLIGIWEIQWTGTSTTYGTSDGSENLHTEDATDLFIAFATKPIASAGSASIALTTTNTTDTTNSLAIALKPTGSGQFARPATTVAAGNWDGFISGVDQNDAANLDNYIDETTADDTDSIRSATSPSDDTCTIGLSAIETPVAGTVTMRIRARFL